MEVPQSRLLQYFTPQAGTSLIDSSSLTDNNYSPTEEFSNLTITGSITNGTYNHSSAHGWHQMQSMQQYPTHRDRSSTGTASHFGSVAGATSGSSLSYRPNTSSSHQMFLSPGGSGTCNGNPTTAGSLSCTSRALNMYQNMSGVGSSGGGGGGRYQNMYDRTGAGSAASYMQSSSSHSQGASANAANYFLSNDIRTDAFNKSIGKSFELNSHVAEYQQTVSAPVAIPPALMPPFEVNHYKYLTPLDSQRSYAGTKSSVFACVTSCYSALDSRDGHKCFLRRVHNFRPPTNKCMFYIESWKKVSHPNVVTLREVFTTKAFGDNSTVFVYDYLASVATLSQRIEAAAAAGNAPRISANGHKLLFPETLIWNYIIQLTAAMRSVHMSGLACRSIDVTKILIDSLNRLYLNGCCVIDTLTCDNYHVSVKAEIPSCQQDDLKNLAKVTMALASGSDLALLPENFKSSYDLIHSSQFSEDLRHFINYLFLNSQRSKNLNDIMPMIGARFYAQFEASLLRSDQLEQELVKEAHNSRMLRLLVKLGSINERPDFNMDTSWSETGDRYLLKLFRDYVFHQVTEDGSPWLDMSHVTSCLNKLDCGVDERLMLVSRDSQNALVVTYTDLKMCMDNTFSELSMSSMAAAAAAANLVTNPAANTTITNPSHDPTSAMVMPMMSSPVAASSGVQSMHMLNGGGDAMQKYMMHQHLQQQTSLNGTSSAGGGCVGAAVASATDQFPHMNGPAAPVGVAAAGVSSVLSTPQSVVVTSSGGGVGGVSTDISSTNSPMPNGNMVNPLYNGTVD